MIEETAAGTSRYGTRPLPATAKKNGYVFIYVSNESTNTVVYFDDFTVRHTRDAIVEDNAYYPFGLKIQGISARAAGKAKTKEGYQGDYSEQDDESGYNEFELRFYDAQIGRWTGVDPYDEFSSGYIGIGNDPVNNIDPRGGDISSFALNHFLPAIAGAVIGAAITKGDASD
jgi:RHS repeat-associated protein